MKEVFQNFKENWITYGFETLVVVVGILGAYALNSWNEERKNTIRERELLLELSQNLESNILQFNGNIIKQEELVRSIDIILDHLENKKPYQDSLSFHFRRLIFLEEFTISSSAYETLKSVGFNVIRSNSIRMKLILLYEMEYQVISNRIKDVAIQRYPVSSSYLNKYFRTNRELLSVPTDYVSLQQNQEYINWLYHQRAWKNAVIGMNERLIGPTTELITEVDNYLND